MKLTTIIAESPYSPAAVAVYKSLGLVYHWFDLSEEDREKILPEADVLVVRLGLTVSRELIDRMPRLKIIATSTTGLNHIDVGYAEQKNITIISLRGHTEFLDKIPSTAEETIGLIFALLRNFLWAFDDVKSGRWLPNNWVGYQVFGKTLGILGFGRLGKMVARYVRGFGMKVIAHDPYVAPEVFKNSGVTLVDFNAVFREADVVSLHVLLESNTTELVKEEHLRLMKSSAYLINTARAELLEKGLLEKALRNKWIAGAALDVLWDEHSDGRHLKNNPLVEYAKKNQNLIIVPHIGGATFEAMAVTQDFIAELVKKYFKK